MMVTIGTAVDQRTLCDTAAQQYSTQTPTYVKYRSGYVPFPFDVQDSRAGRVARDPTTLLRLPPLLLPVFSSFPFPAAAAAATTTVGVVVVWDSNTKLARGTNVFIMYSSSTMRSSLQRSNTRSTTLRSTLSINTCVCYSVTETTAVTAIDHNTPDAKQQPLPLSLAKITYPKSPPPLVCNKRLPLPEEQCCLCCVSLARSSLLQPLKTEREWV